MPRRLVVGLDGSEYAANAVRVACEAARTFGATVVGVGVVDCPAIETSTLGAGVGAYHLAQQVREHKLEEARTRVERLLAELVETCGDHRVKFEKVCREGTPWEAIAAEGRTADAILLGTRTHFHFATQDEPDDTLRHVMHAGTCPVVAIPRDAALPKTAVIAYDGSTQAARTMRAYVHIAMGDPAAREIVLLHVGEVAGRDLSDEIERARRYLDGYGFRTTVVHRTGPAGDAIAAVAGEHQPAVVVIGAYGHRGLRDWFFGTTADALVKIERFPLFVYH